MAGATCQRLTPLVWPCRRRFRGTLRVERRRQLERKVGCQKDVVLDERHGRAHQVNGECSDARQSHRWDREWDPNREDSVYERHLHANGESVAAAGVAAKGSAGEW